MAAASASWLLALIIATALISTSAWRVRDGSVHVTCRDVVVVFIGQRAAWRAVGANLTPPVLESSCGHLKF